MKQMAFTLLTDGSSDRALKSILTWLLSDLGHRCATVKWADTRTVRDPPAGLKGRIALALRLYPCDVLCVHRDSERTSIDERLLEIRSALPACAPPLVCVIPVRMTEAWLLFDEAAIRRAAGNPSGTLPLGLPEINVVERLPNPKALLREILGLACGLPEHRRRKFDLPAAVQLVAHYTRDFSPLRRLPAFQAFEAQLRNIHPQ